MIIVYVWLHNYFMSEILWPGLIKTTITTKTVFLGPPGGRNKTVPAISVDTPRGRRKGEPQHKVLGNGR